MSFISYNYMKTYSVLKIKLFSLKKKKSTVDIYCKGKKKNEKTEKDDSKKFE